MDEIEFENRLSKMSWNEIIKLYHDCKNENILVFSPFIIHFKRMKYVQILALYQNIKKKKPKMFDYQKVYEKTVKFYIDKKGYGIEQANAIAQKVTEDQQSKWNESH